MQGDVLGAFLREYEWIHTGLGILGNVLFFVGSVLFLFESIHRIHVYAFIVGSFLMLVGSAGSAVVKYVTEDS